MTAHLENWAGASAALVGAVFVQLTVQMVLMQIFAAHRDGRAGATTRGQARLRSLRSLSLCTVFVLIFGHLAQALLWTVLYLALGEFRAFEDAAYFSLASYTTVGAAELELSRGHRILGALEAGMGTLMFGWSTALLVALVGRTRI